MVTQKPPSITRNSSCCRLLIRFEKRLPRLLCDHPGVFFSRKSAYAATPLGGVLYGCNDVFSIYILVLCILPVRNYVLVCASYVPARPLFSRRGIDPLPTFVFIRVWRLGALGHTTTPEKGRGWAHDVALDGLAKLQRLWCLISPVCGVLSHAPWPSSKVDTHGHGSE